MKSELKKHSTSLAFVLLAGCLLWSLWPALVSMSNRWSTDPRYAHGYLVPAFALALLWMRRGQVNGVKPRPNAWGLGFLALGGAVQLVGGYFHIGTIEGLALLPYLC